MFNFKFYMSFSALSLVLSSLPVLAGQLIPESAQEEAISTMTHNLGIKLQPQQTLTYGGNTFVKGEVPGDGACIFHSLNVLFPEKGINREAFIKQLRQKIANPDHETFGIIEELASELFYAISESHHIEGTSLAFTGENIKKLHPFLTFDGPGQIADSISMIKEAKGVLDEMIDKLAEKGTMLSLSSKDDLLGTFGLVCQFFKVNLDVFTTIRGTDQLEVRRRFRFGGNEQVNSVLFATVGAHVSPLCGIGDSPMRKKLAIRILQMMRNREGNYQKFSEEQIKSALKAPQPQIPGQGQPVNRMVLVDTLTKTLIAEIDAMPNRQRYIEGLEERRKKLPGEKQEIFGVALALAKDHFGM